MIENPNLEQVYFSRTAKSNHWIAQDSTRLRKWMAYYDRSFEIENSIDLMPSVLTCLNELS